MDNPFSKKIKFSKDGRTFGWGASPDADWKVIFITTVVLILLVSAWDIFTYFKVRSSDEVPMSLEENTPTLNRESLRRVAEYYQGKAKEFEKIQMGKESANVGDPSI